MWSLLVLSALIGASCVSGQCDAGTRPLPVTNEPTTIQTPGFDGVTPYEDDLLCEWVITASPQDVRILLTDFGLEDCIDCSCDSLQIYDGPDDQGTLLYNLCGGDLNGLPLEIVGGLQVFIRFQSDVGNTGGVFGFSMITTFVDAACDTDSGKDMPGPSGTITSTFFPNNYPNGQDCLWNFNAPEGQFVELEINALDVQTGCTSGLGQGFVFDYLQFVEGDARTVLARFFGNEFVPGFKFRNNQGNRAFLQFWSDSSEQFGGFNVTYRYI